MKWCIIYHIKFNENFPSGNNRGRAECSRPKKASHAGPSWEFSSFTSKQCSRWAFARFKTWITGIIHKFLSLLWLLSIIDADIIQPHYLGLIFTRRTANCMNFHHIVVWYGERIAPLLAFPHTPQHDDNARKLCERSQTRDGPRWFITVGETINSL